MRRGPRRRTAAKRPVGKAVRLTRGTPPSRTPSDVRTKRTPTRVAATGALGKAQKAPRTAPTRKTRRGLSAAEAVRRTRAAKTSSIRKRQADARKRFLSIMARKKAK